MADQTVITVDAAQVVAARGAIKAAQRLGREPDPLMVRIANARRGRRSDPAEKVSA